MKNLLLLTTTLAVGYLLGVNRKLKNRVVITDLQLRGGEMVATSRFQDYRSQQSD